jgi:hypothetical protein
MLKTKWKTGSVAGEKGSDKAKTGQVEAPASGQVRSFRITEIDLGAKRISLELVA